ncbi:MAG TPA: hypothetical protein VFH68_18665 [Polyangia bacterium]|nr:hypothetical protein [Polyangia bacterium]
MAALCLAGVAIYVVVVKDVYPPPNWLFWRLLVLWGWCALLHGACLAFGHLIVTRWLGLRDLPVIEALVTSAAVGFVAFGMAMYLAGALALFRPAFAIVLPVVMIAAGGPELWRFARRAWVGEPGQERAPRSRPDPITAAVIAFGVLCLGLLYLESMTPDAINYDARWYHLTVAQDYAREGKIVSFPADYPKCYPHLAGLIHTWGWLVPGLSQPLRWMLALHNEFCLFLWTLLGVAAGVAWLVERTRVKGAWAAFFLFPGISLYDSNIGGGADHVVAFFALPLFLAALRAAPDLSPRRSALVGIIAAGALLTRYQSVYLFVPVTALLGIRWLRLATSGGAGVDRARLWRGPAVLVAFGALLSAPHFLKNWIFYRNPVYPFMLDFFSGSRPFPDVPQQLADENCRPHGTFWDQVGQAIVMTFTFSFRPHYSFARDYPVMGSLFSLLLPVIPFVRRRRRLLVCALMSLAAILTWSATYLIDRQAQIYVPILAAVTGATILRVWELGWVARGGLVAVVGMQVVWGGDAFFISGHGRLADAVEMIRSGYEGRAKTRFAGYLAAEAALNTRLPRQAVVLFHNTRLSLGLNRKVVQDLAGFQGLISYRGVRTPRDVYDLYHALGITHIVHQRGVWVAFSKQEEVMFLFFIDRFAGSRFHEGGYEVIEMPSTPPPEQAPYRVLAMGLNGYADGVYPVEAMKVIEPIPDPHRTFPAPAVAVTPAVSPGSPEVIDQVNAVLVAENTRLPPDLDAALREKFQASLSYGGRFTVYLRR